MENFVQIHKLFETDQTVTHSASLPAELNALLDQVNSNSYADGFFKFVRAEQFRDYTSLWKFNPDDCFPFLKSAFGHLVFFHDGNYKAINPVYNEIDQLAGQGELDFVMDILLCDRASLEGSFFIDIYEQVSAQLGPPALDEIYAFVPALGIGGSRDPNNVQKLSMEQQMLILSQL